MSEECRPDGSRSSRLFARTSWNRRWEQSGLAFLSHGNFQLTSSEEEPVLRERYALRGNFKFSTSFRFRLLSRKVKKN